MALSNNVLALLEKKKITEFLKFYCLTQNSSFKLFAKEFGTHLPSMMLAGLLKN